MKRGISVLLILALLLTLTAGMLPVSAAGLRTYTGSENEAGIYSYLVANMGFNNAAAAGILANIYKESSFNPNATGDNGTSYGICQWHASRWDNLKSYCNIQGYDWHTLEGQLRFMEYELYNDYPSLVTNLHALHNTDYGAYRAAYYWCYQFERPAGYKTGSSEKRGEFARDTFWPIYCGDDYEVTTEWSSSYPEGVDASMIETWDEYRRKDYETQYSSEPSLVDWELLESGWVVTEEGSVSFVEDWPEGFDRKNALYTKYNNTPKPETNTDTKKTTASYKTDGFIYYHWCDEDGTISPVENGNSEVFHAFFTATSPDSLKKSSSGDGSYEFPGRDECSNSNCYFALEVRKQTYKIEEYLYKYGRWGEWGKWLNWNSLVEKAISKLDPATYQLEFRHQYRVILEPEITVELLRLAGDNRVKTASAISEASFEKSDAVVIASGNDFPDALAGGLLAYALKAPILLVRTKLDSAVRNEILRLDAKDIYILGGSAAVSDSIETELEKLGKVTRVAGDNRFQTAVRVAEMTEEISGEAPTSVFFASSENFADAISASAASAILGMPILYIPSNGKINRVNEEYLAMHNIERATVLGGFTAVSEAAEKNLKSLGVVCEERLMGDNRYGTCLEILAKYENVLSGDIMTAATGLDYPDALTGGVYAAINRAPLMLVGKKLTESQKAYLKARGGEKLTIFGGETGAVSEAVANEIMRAMSAH